MDERIKNKILRRYRCLMPSQSTLSKTERERLALDSLANRLICCPSDKMKEVFLYSILQTGKLPEIYLQSVYYVVDVYFSKSSIHQKLSDIRPKLLLIYSGMGEFRNSEMENLNIQVCENQRLLSNHVWLYWKGTKGQFQQKYPTLSKYITSMKWVKIELGDKLSGAVQVTANGLPDYCEVDF